MVVVVVVVGFLFARKNMALTRTQVRMTCERDTAREQRPRNTTLAYSALLPLYLTTSCLDLTPLLYPTYPPSLLRGVSSMSRRRCCISLHLHRLYTVPPPIVLALPCLDERLPCPALPHPTLPCLALCCVTLPYPTVGHPTLPCAALWLDSTLTLDTT